MFHSFNTPFLSTNIQACGHHFCSECWIGTIEGAIDAGPDCLFLLCPAGQCRLVVPDALVSKYITDVDKLQRYRRFQLDSFVSQNKASSFCPAPGCHRVIEYPKRDNTRVIVCAVPIVDLMMSCNYCLCPSRYHIIHIYHIHNTLTSLPSPHIISTQNSYPSSFSLIFSPHLSPSSLPLMSPPHLYPHLL